MRFLEDIEFSVNNHPWWRYIDSITRRYSLEFSLEMVFGIFLLFLVLKCYIITEIFIIK